MLKFAASSLVAVVALGSMTTVIPSIATAQDGHSVVVEVEGPMMAPSVPAPSLPAAPMEVAVAYPAPAIECCPIEVIREVALLSAKRAYRCHGAPVQQVLCVDNPADCCPKHYAVPVCVPACCTGEPVCCGTKVGLLGRGYVTYRWPCGFEAVVTFRVHGGVLITYR